MVRFTTPENDWLFTLLRKLQKRKSVTFYDFAMCEEILKKLKCAKEVEDE